MNFIVIIQPNGEIEKVTQDNNLYVQLMTEIRALDPTFSPYSDDGDLGLFYDVIGANFHTRFKTPQSTTTTTTTKAPVSSSSTTTTTTTLEAAAEPWELKQNHSKENWQH